MVIFFQDLCDKYVQEQQQLNGKVKNTYLYKLFQSLAQNMNSPNRLSIISANVSSEKLVLHHDRNFVVLIF